MLELNVIREALNTFLLDAMKAFIILFLFQYTSQVIIGIGVTYEYENLKRNSAIISVTLTSLTQLLLVVMGIASVSSLVIYFIK